MIVERRGRMQDSYFAFFGALTCSNVVELRGFEPRTEPGEMALELRILSFGVVTRVLRFLRMCVGVLRDVTVLDRLVWRPTARG
jgi:hypothetical protein